MAQVGKPCFRVRNTARATTLGDAIEVADGPIRKLVGLLGRRDLSPGAGLWFPGSNSIHMMGMHFPIDVVFVGQESDGASIVTDLRTSLAPWTGIVWWSRGAKAALELPAGTIAASGTQIGDRLLREMVG